MRTSKNTRSVGWMVIVLAAPWLGCSKSEPLELADFRRNSLSIKTNRIQEQLFPKSYPNVIASEKVGTAFLYNLPHLANPKSIQCELKGIDIIQMDCVNQPKCYGNLGPGYALRIHLFNDANWPSTLIFQVNGKRIPLRIVDPQDPSIHLYAMDWKPEPIHAFEESTDHLLWVIKRTVPHDVGPPILSNSMIWESWVLRDPKNWAYIGCLEGTPAEQTLFLRQRKAKPAAAGVWELP